MGLLPGAGVLKTAVWTIAILAVLNRVAMVKSLINPA